MTTLIASLALVIAILAFAHSIRMKNWIERIEARNETDEPEVIWRKAGAI